MKHTSYDLKQMQSLPLEAKIIMSQRRIKDWYDHWHGDVYVSFSGGKDSTVLKHLVETTSGVYDVPSLFINTGLEYPEIQKFAMSQPNVITVRPKMRFDEVIKKYGYPVISKEVARRVGDCQNKVPYALRQLDLGKEYRTKNGKQSSGAISLNKYRYLIDADIKISSKCCDVMKKKPAHEYEKETGRKAFIGTLADESHLRYTTWLKNGCNAFNANRPTSKPLSFWTEQDILEYIRRFDIPYCSVYGDIIEDQNGNLNTTGCDRTGCTFCMFGCHLEKEPNRFQRLKKSHPRQYTYCINGGEYVDGIWQPNKEGLGLSHVLDTLGVQYGKEEE